MKHELRYPSYPKVVFTIGKITFLELLRDKILLNVLFFAGFLFFLTFAASHLMVFHPERLVVNFGFAAVQISTGMLAVLLSPLLVLKEIERKTITVMLSKPVHEYQFIIGKFFGLALILLCNTLLCAVLWLFMLLVLWEGGGWYLQTPLLVGCFFAFLKGLMLGMVGIFFSCFTTASLSLFCNISLYLIGINLSFLSHYFRSDNVAFQYIITTFFTVLPNYELFQLNEEITYQLPLSLPSVLWACAYHGCFSVLLLLAAGYLLQHKEL